ncbi:ATP12 [Sanghuangporus vaninii]
MSCRAGRLLWSRQSGTPVTATNRAETTLKRFWKSVDIDDRPDGIAVTLDRRALKTPSGNTIILPHEKRLAAALIANEWENQDKVLRPHTLPMTSLASRAIDALREKNSRDDVIGALLKYLDTDTICFHQDSPKALVRLQNAHWKPLLSWIRDEFGLDIRVYASLFSSDQPEQTKNRLSEIVKTFDEWQLAGMERATYSTKSFIIALALVNGRIDVEEAAQAAHVEVNSQIEAWGEVEDSHDVDYQDIRRQLGSVACLV